jgi:hypothetical protein
MMNIIKSALIIVGVLLPVTSGSQPSVQLYHFEDSSCGAWIKSSGEGNEARSTRQIYEFWFNGFVSGYNFGNPENQVRRMPTPETLFLYIDKFCRENPLSVFTAAAFRLVEETREKPLPQKR